MYKDGRASHFSDIATQLRDSNNFKRLYQPDKNGQCHTRHLAVRGAVPYPAGVTPYRRAWPAQFPPCPGWTGSRRPEGHQTWAALRPRARYGRIHRRQAALQLDQHRRWRRFRRRKRTAQRSVQHMRMRGFEQLRLHVAGRVLRKHVGLNRYGDV